MLFVQTKLVLVLAEPLSCYLYKQNLYLSYQNHHHAICTNKTCTCLFRTRTTIMLFVQTKLVLVLSEPLSCYLYKQKLYLSFQNHYHAICTNKTCTCLFRTTIIIFVQTKLVLVFSLSCYLYKQKLHLSYQNHCHAICTNKTCTCLKYVGVQ